MLDVVQRANVINSMSDESLSNVDKLEEFILKQPQVDIPTTHTLHGGVYTRTIKIPAGVILTGALIKIPTTIIIEGSVTVYVGEKSKNIDGYTVFVAHAHRKQAFIAHTDTCVTMIFRTDARTVKEAEQQFTDDSNILMSRHSSAINNFIITEELECPAA